MAIVDIACEGEFIVSYDLSLHTWGQHTTGIEFFNHAFGLAVDDSLLSESDRSDCEYRVREPGPIYTIDEVEDGSHAVGEQQPHSGLVAKTKTFATHREASDWLLAKLGFR